MANEKTHSALMGYVLRLALGGLLLLVGIGKFSGGVNEFVTSSAAAFEGTLIPMAMAKAYLTLVPLLEVVVGGLLLLGLFTHVAAWIAAFMFSLFVVGLAATGKPEMMVAVVNNFIYIFASLGITKSLPGLLSLDHLVSGK